MQKITVLLPTYNDSVFLKSSINSILRQTFKEFELLIIDDGSTDDTENIIASFKDSRINYKKKEHTGLADSLNFGLLNSAYDWVARMDADDLAHPQRLEKQINFINNNPSYQVIASWYAVFEEDKIKYFVKSQPGDSYIKQAMSLHSPFCHSGVLYNKDLIKSEKYRDTVFEDYDLWLRLMGRIKFYIIPEVLLFYRFRHNSLSRDDIKEKHRIYYKIQEAYYDISFGTNFNFSDKYKQAEIRGWREYFYGSKIKSLKHWGKLNLGIFSKPRIIFAILTLILPENLFIKFKELRTRFRLEYLFSYFSNTSKEARETFNKIVSINYTEERN